MVHDKGTNMQPMMRSIVTHIQFQFENCQKSIIMIIQACDRHNLVSFSFLYDIKSICKVSAQTELQFPKKSGTNSQTNRENYIIDKNWEIEPYPEGNIILRTCYARSISLFSISSGQETTSYRCKMNKFGLKLYIYAIGVILNELLCCYLLST